MKVCEQLPYSVLHVGAGRYLPDDWTHSTAAIWRRLAAGFQHYTVVGRSETGRSAQFRSGHLVVNLLGSKTAREAEFLVSQFGAVPIGMAAKADVTVAQCPALGGLAGLQINNKCGARLLVELHGFHYFTSARVGSADWITQQISARVFARAHRIRVLSEGMRKRVVAKYGADLESRIICVPPRVDLSRFDRVRSDWRLAGRPRIAMSGGVNENKGQARLIRSVLSSSLDADIWIFGDGPQLEACRRLATDLGGADRVRFFGHLTHEQIAELLPQADALVVFSRTEGTPRALLEAMAVGVPVVTVDVGFCADVVTHGVEGFVLGFDPEGELPIVLQTLLQDEGLRARLGAAGRSRAQREFDADMVYARYRALIAETARA